MANEEELKEVINCIRGCVISTKERLTLRQLNHDFKTLMGEWIPFRKYGFECLEDLIESSNELSLSRSGGDFYVTAKRSEKSSHIKDLVCQQKTAKRKPAARSYFKPSFGPRMQQQQNFSKNTTFHHQGQGSRWHPKSSFRLNRSSYNGSSHQTHKVPPVASKVVIPQHSTFNRMDNNRNEQKTYDHKPQRGASAPAAAPRPKVDLNQRMNNNRIKEPIEKLSNEANNHDSPLTYRVRHAPSSSSSRTNEGESTLKASEVKLKAESNGISQTNPLSSTRKRLSKKMSELTLDRDSGNSSPTNENPPSPSKTPDFVRTEDAFFDLTEFVKLHKLGEIEENVTKIQRTKKSTFFSCKVKIGSHGSWSSYPDEAYTAEQAKVICCKKALDELIPKFQNKRRSLLISSQEEILERIPPLLEEHRMGLVSYQVAINYVEQYNELLPDDWITIIDSSPCVRIEKIQGIRSESDYVLHHCQPSDVLQKKSQMNTPTPSPTDVVVPSNTVNFGEDGRLLAQVTCLVSTKEVWCEQIGTKEREIFDEMFSRMQVYYQEHKTQLVPDSILPDTYYIAKYDDGYFRVRVLKIISEEEVGCFFVDFGEEMPVKKTDIFKLKREYATSAAQAFACRLYGLEDFYDIANVNLQCLNNLCDKTVCIELAEEVTGNELPGVLPVYLFEVDSGISINDMLLNKLSIDLATPLLSDGINEVHVSHVEPTGDIFVYMKTKGYDNFQVLRKELEEEVMARPPVETLEEVTMENSKDKLYFMQDKTSSWLRVTLIDWSPDAKMAQVYFVDEGHTDVITVNNKVLYPLDKLNETLCSYPHQSIRVKLALKSIPNNLLDLTKTMLPRDQLVLLKIVGDSEGFPLVKLFRRNSEGLFCINESLDLQLEISSKEEVLKSKLNTMSKDIPANVPSTGSLKCPPLPQVGSEFFEVHVSVAVNPYNFFVQPLESLPRLNEMMTKLQDVCKNVEYGVLKVTDILPGNVYASKFTDDCWYRTSVIKVINSGSVSVFYCDFGYYQTLSVCQLVSLDPTFLELPYQALKAKLADIKPKQNKWSMEDCEQFKELTEKKMFCAKLTSIENDYLYESDILLRLVLIDTSTEDDVIVGQELVKRGIAVVEE